MADPTPTLLTLERVSGSSRAALALLPLHLISSWWAKLARSSRAARQLRAAPYGCAAVATCSCGCGGVVGEDEVVVGAGARGSACASAAVDMRVAGRAGGRLFGGGGWDRAAGGAASGLAGGAAVACTAGGGTPGWGGGLAAVEAETPPAVVAVRPPARAAAPVDMVTPPAVAAAPVVVVTPPAVLVAAAAVVTADGRCCTLGGVGLASLLSELSSAAPATVGLYTFEWRMSPAERRPPRARGCVRWGGRHGRRRRR